MIPFFRKIRLRSLSDSQIGKYLLYALGEIILVVLGILIALQINNWNEYRKLRVYELNQLKEIKENLIDSKIEVDEIQDFNQKTAALYKRILLYSENDSAYSTELDSAFYLFTNWATPFIPQNGYETLKLGGIDIIQDEALKKSIIEMYEQNFRFLMNDADKGEWVLSQAVTEAFAAKHIRYYYDDNRRYARPNNWDSLKRDPEFNNILSILIRKRSAGLMVVNETSNEIARLIAAIDRELENRRH